MPPLPSARSHAKASTGRYFIHAEDEPRACLGCDDCCNCQIPIGYDHCPTHGYIGFCKGTGRLGREGHEPELEIQHLPGRRTGWDRGWGSGDWCALILDVDMAFNLGTTRLFADSADKVLAAAREALG